MAKEGRNLENKISKELLKINRKENGFFIKSPTPMKMINVNNKIVPIYSNKALCDFIGIYNSRFVLIEVKNISGKRFEFDRLKDHQLKQLSAIKRHGGVAMIFFSIGIPDTILSLEVEDYLVFKAQTEKKSINIDALKIIGREVPLKEIEEYIIFLTS